ncbi:hemagglutinin repeat-containing protein [Pectobacterium sp. B1J-3]|uniref:hemagglutinin repeat-containing protein n=1 Tax=Pectobacterium sp. B1J-3 TaxID=3385371 RepID=UPI00390625E5
MKPIKTTQRLIVYTLINLIAFQPLLPAMAAGVQVATGNTALDRAGNGVPVINIATPNGAGISHNQYRDFNVDKPGLILNNGTERLNSTQLGGLIQSNPNLKGKAADAIINEVVSTNRSTLAGYLEVGGKQASVIVANPNGITCDGCGFINTPQVTLTTGKPQLDAQGNLQRIDVTRGDITLTGQGLDASKSDYLSLISRTAQINAGLNANDAQIVLGANQVDANGKITAQTADSSVKVALDTRALGGMYTNRIKLVSSDKGVGVNVGNLSARSGDITLSANGKLSIGDVVTQGNLRAEGDALALQGKQQAANTLSLQAKQSITLQDATLRAGKDIAIQSGGELKAHQSIISAGVDTKGKVKQGNRLSIKSDGVTISDAQLAAGNIMIDAGKSLQQDAKSGIKAEALLDVRGGAVSLAGIAGAEELRLEAQTLNGADSAQLQAKERATVHVTQQGDWQGDLTAGNTLTVDGGRMLQRGTVAGKTVALALEALDNQGEIASLQGLTFSGTQLTNSGTLVAAEQMVVNADWLDNAGLLSAQGEVKLELQTLLNNQGKILTEKRLFLLADSVTNHGAMQGDSVALQSNQLTNQGEMMAGSLELASQTVENHGVINAQHMIALHGGSMLNNGTLSAGEKLALTLDSTLDNRSMIQAGHTAAVTTDKLRNEGTLTAPELQLKTGAFSNRGTIQADNALVLESARELTQSADGKLLAGNSLTLKADSAETDGDIQARQFLINAERWINAGKTSVEGNGQITARQMDNRGDLLASGNWTIDGDTVSNAGALQGHSLNIQANTIENSGQAQALNTVDLIATDTFINSGDWLSGAELHLQAAEAENRGNLQALALAVQGEEFANRGSLSGINRLTLSLNGTLENHGSMQSSQLHAEASQINNQGSLYGTDTLTLTAVNGFTNQQNGTLLSQGATVLKAAQVVNLGEWQAQNLQLDARNLTNRGQIQGDNGLRITLEPSDGHGVLLNQGMLISGGDTQLSARGIDNQGALLSQGRTVLTGMTLQNAGRIISGTELSLLGDYQGDGLLNTAGTLTLQGDTLVNRGRWESRALSLQGQTFTNQGVLLGDSVAISAHHLLNDGDITGVDDLTLSLRDVLQNTGDLRSNALAVTTHDLNNAGSVLGVNALQVNVSGLLDNTGVISGNQTLAVKANRVQQAGTLEGKTVTVDSASLVNQGNIVGVDALTLAITGNVTNSGNVLTQGTGTLSSKQVDNSGLWQADTLALDVDKITNAGQLLGIQALSIDSRHRLTNQLSGKLLTQGVAVLQASEVVNHGEWLADNLTLHTERLTNTGLVQADRHLAIEVTPAAPTQRALLAIAVSLATDVQQIIDTTPLGSLENSGTLTSGGDVQLRALEIANQGTLSGLHLETTANALTNDGIIAGVDALQLTLADQLTNSGTLHSTALTLSATDLFNQGELSGNDVRLTLQNGVLNRGLISGVERMQLETSQLDQRGDLESRDLRVQANVLDNQGNMLGVDALTLAINTTARNSGKWLSQGDSLLTAQRLENNGHLQARNVVLTADEVENAGQVLALSTLSLTAKNRLTNVQDGKLLSQGVAVLKAVDAINAGEWQAQNLTLEAQHLTNGGHIQGDRALKMTLANGALHNQGELWGENTNIAAQTLTNEGNITGAAGLQLALGGEIVNQGELNSYRLHTQAEHLSNTGQINGIDRLELSVNDNLNNQGTLYGSALTLRASDLTNSGTITGVDSLLLELDRTLNNLGELGSHELTISANDVFNHGTITGVNGLTFLLGNRIDNQGTLNSQTLAITANALINGGQINGIGDLQLTLTGELTNTGDLISQRIAATAQDALNHGQMIGSDDLQLTLRDKLDNRGLISGSNTLDVMAKNLDQQGTLEARVLHVEADTLDNRGEILGVDALTLAITESANNQGKWLSQGNSLLMANQVENHGQWQAGDITLHASDLINSGQIFGINTLALTIAHDLNNQQNGKLFSQGIAVLRAESVANDGTLQTDTLEVDAQRLINRGRVQGDRGLAITLDSHNPASRLVNQGMLISGSNSQLQSSQFENQGTVSVVGEMAVQSADTLNTGNLIAGGALSLDGNYQGTGLVQTDDTLTLSGNQLNNNGRWESRVLMLNGGTLNNQGTIIGEHGITLELRDGLTVGNSGQLLTNGTLLAQAGQINNEGFWQGKALELTANEVINGGSLFGQQRLRLDAGQTYQGDAQSRVISDGDAAINAERLTQRGEIAAAALQLSTETLDNRGRVLGMNGLTVTNRGNLINHADGELLTNGAGRIDSTTLSNAGTLQANDLQLRASDIDNQGRIQGTDALRLLDVLRYVGDKNSQLLSKSDATLNTKQAENAGLWQAGALTLNGELFSNRGTVAGLNSLSLNSDQLINQGELFSQGVVTLTGNTLENGGTLTGIDGFTLQLTDRVDNLATGRLLSGGIGDLTTGVLTNQGLWQSDDLRLTARELDQQGNLLGVQHGTLQLTGTYLGTQGSELVSGGDLMLAANDITNRGQVQGKTLTLSGDTLNNQGSLRSSDALNATLAHQLNNTQQANVSSDGTLNVQAAAVKNQGEIKAAVATLIGTTLTNTGTVQGITALLLNATGNIVNQQSGQLLSDGSTTLKAVVVENFGWLQGRALDVQSTQFTQQGSLMAQDKLTLRIPQWVNNGLLQAGELEIIADQLDNHGTLLGLTQLALQTQRLINRQGAKLYSAQDLRLKTAELQQDGQLVALGNLTADITGPLIFTQSMAAGRKLTLNVAGDLDQRGTLQGNSVHLSSTGTLINQGDILAGSGDSRISAKDIAQQESGSVQAGGNLTLVSDNTLKNQGLIGTTGDLLIQAGSVLHNSSMIYAGGNMYLLSDSLTNVFGTLLAGNNLWIQRDAKGNASTSLLNSSGTIETQSGDITINTGTLTNQREGLVVTETKSQPSADAEKAEGTTLYITPDKFSIHDVGYYIHSEASDSHDTDRGFDYNYTLQWALYPHVNNYKIIISEKNIAVDVIGGISKINSSGNLKILSAVFNNVASNVVSYGDLIIEGDKLNNQSYHSGRLTEFVSYKYIGPSPEYSLYQWNKMMDDSVVAERLEYVRYPSKKDNFVKLTLDNTPITEQTIGESYNASIQAGGTITADFKQDISNTTLQPGSGGFMPAATIPVLDGMTTLSPLQKQTTRQLVSQDSSFHAGVTNIAQTNSEQADFAGDATNANTVSKNVQLTQQAGIALQTGARAEQVGTVAVGQTTPGQLTLNPSGSVSLQHPAQGGGTVVESILLTGETTNTMPSLVAKTGELVPTAMSNGATSVLEKPGKVKLDPVKPGVGQETDTSPAPLTATALLDAIGHGLQNLSNNPLSDYPLPTGNNGLLVVDPNTDSRYLIHTNPKLEQLGQVDNTLFHDLQTLLGQQPSTVVPVETRSQWTQTDKVLGSSYLLNKLNLDADHDYRFLGDEEFDTRYISQAVLKQSGQRYLNGTGSDLAQMQMLLDNAAQAQKGLNLQLGVSLTSDQVANLSQSIVWWENIEVNGQTVLAPKLYLAQADKNNLQGSAIVANKVDLNAGGSVTNNGTLKAVEVLAIASGDKVDNHEGGLIKSDGGLNLVALNNITNSGSRIEGKEVQLASIDGDIINQTESRNFQTVQPTSSRSGTGSIIFTEVGKTAEIVAGNNLMLSAGKDIRNVSARLNSGQDMTLNAKGNVAIESLTLTNNRVDIGWRSSNTDLNTAIQGSSLNANGILKVVADRDIQVDASQLSGGSELTLAAGNDIRLTAQDTLKETLNQGRRTTQRRMQEVANSQLLSGGDMNLIAGRDVLSEASSLDAKGNATLAAGRDLNLLSEEEENYSGNWRKRHTDWQQTITQQSTELTAGKNLNLQAGSNINLQAAQGVAEGSVIAQAGKDINLLSATETQHTFFEETKIKKKTFSKTVTHTVRDNFRSDEKESVLSGDQIVLRANHDINMAGSALSGEQLVALNAGNDINMAASIETQRVYEKRTKKKSGLMSGGGLGFSIGTQSSRAEYKGAKTTQSESRSVVGVVDGDVVMQSGQRIAIGGSDIIAASKDGQHGNITLSAQEIDITPGQDTRDITRRFETKSSGIGISLKGTPADSYQNLRDIGKTDGVTQKARLYMSETAAMVFDVPQIVLSIGRNSSKTEQRTQGAYQTGSALTAAGNIQLQTTRVDKAENAFSPHTGDILIAGSSIQAGGNLLLNAERDINLQSASDWEKTNANSTHSGWSFSNAIPDIGSSIRHLSGGPNHGVSTFPVASESAKEKQQGDTVAQTASTLSGNNVTLSSQQRDINITGSAVTGIKDVAIIANNGNVTVNPGQNHARNEITGSSSSVGDLGGDGYSGTVGWQSSRYHSLDDVNQQSTMRSVIQSGEGNINIAAKENVAIAGADIQAGKSLLLNGRNISVDPAVDTEHRLREQRSSQYGVTTALSGYAVSALQAVERLSQSVEDKKDPRLSAIYAAQSALNLATQTVANNMNASAIKVTVSAGGGSTQNRQQQDSLTREGSQLSANDDIHLRAEKDITLIGADVRGRNIDLTAGDALNLVSAQSESQIIGSTSGSHAGVGVGFGLGGQQNGITLELSASGQKGKEDGNGQSHQLTEVTAAGTVNLRSGADTVLNGAVVSGKHVEATTGGDLLIRSPQDTSHYDSKTTQAGLNISLCVPPICGGQTVAGNANLSQQIMNNRYASVQEQSGIRAGEEGFTIRTNGHTQLDGAVVSSTAAVEKNLLSTGTLGWRDIINASRYKGTSTNLGVSSDSMPTAGLGLVSGKQTGVTHAAVSPATIEIKNRNELRQDVSTLSRDISDANGRVKDGFDRDRIEDKLAIQREATALGVQALDAYKTSKKGEAEEQARARLIAEGVPATELDAQVRTSHEVKQVEKEYGVGSAFWMAGSAFTALASGGLGGNLNGAVSGAAAPYLAALVKDVSEGNEPARIALHTALGAVLAHTQGGNAVGGATGGLVSSAGAEVLANLLYPEAKKGGLSAEQKQLIANLMTIAGAGAGGLTSGNLAGAGSGANVAKNEVENNALSDIIENKVSGMSQEEKYQSAQKQLVAMVEEFKAQNCAGLSAEACSTKISEHRNELLKGATSFGLDFVPVVGDIKGFAEAQSAIDYLAAMAGLIPVAGDAASKAIKAAEMALKKGDVAEASKLINKASDEISGYLPSPGNISLPSSGVGSNAAFSVTNAQLGKKLGKHVEDFGGNASNAADRQRVLDIINDIGSKPDKVVAGKFAGQGVGNGASRGDVFFRVKGNDVVVTKPDGSFVTVLKDGVNNTSVKNALKGDPK